MDARDGTSLAWLAGLSPHAAYAIKQNGMESKKAVREAITAGTLTPEFTPQLGVRTFLEICAWSGAKVRQRPPPRPIPPATERTIAKARRTLERAGYSVTKSPAPMTAGDELPQLQDATPQQ